MTYSYSSWCGPCHQVAPVIEKLTDEQYKSGSTSLPFDLVKIDTDTEVGQILGGKYKVHAQLSALLMLVTVDLTFQLGPSLAHCNCIS
jgi:thiol-disulfide isomerase/thioredoxin